MSEADNMSEEQQIICSVIPSLNHAWHKGQAGRVGVIGGSPDYTGAPYFSAISAMKTGADLAYVFSNSNSSPIIKSYSPELIVIPGLELDGASDQILPYLPRLHSLVIGPGLGRDLQTFTTVGSIISAAKSQDMPLVIDADALFYISTCPEVVRGYTKAILTPNVIEFSRLYTAVFQSDHKAQSDQKAVVANLANALGNITIVRKGPEDIISDGRTTVVCNEKGSPRRCGGQGDLLTGAMGIFTHWSHSASVTHKLSPTIIAALGACMLTRRCARLAFAKHGRTTLTTCLIHQINEAFTSLFPVH